MLNARAIEQAASASYSQSVSSRRLTLAGWQERPNRLQCICFFDWLVIAPT
jgi:hypothetical protein